ncbi:hypothetical protein [Lachnobacterium bovis]|uniref:Uncharacterized protein n=1 Tax=Lachnobacterium bovis DSM 14045 TaxID=1122142 RepID=A0A1H3MH34_9FIRM|nr:hypothetical protein [Lachnobacterium bovis]SDY75654.1 hypothetical protein SAMN02910414_02302 [Lachnobacterium bovis DSM 14045]
MVKDALRVQGIFLKIQLAVTNRVWYYEITDIVERWEKASDGII